MPPNHATMCSMNRDFVVIGDTFDRDLFFRALQDSDGAFVANHVYPNSMNDMCDDTFAVSQLSQTAMRDYGAQPIDAELPKSTDEVLRWDAQNEDGRKMSIMVEKAPLLNESCRSERAREVLVRGLDRVAALQQQRDSLLPDDGSDTSLVVASKESPRPLLHLLAPTDAALDLLRAEYAHLPQSIKSNVIVVVSVSHDMDWLYSADNSTVL
eukprot:TRINITY_DN15973_c0_g1_i1.p1 TRINITY_DN15973_c0_g1~~TRINITY_DN15973_c0_g1_i1.p1  ORF type:complete len:211 (+),score=36.35 TRINITY_DN15973_c0_g1_i1:150-782(+)